MFILYSLLVKLSLTHTHILYICTHLRTAHPILRLEKSYGPCTNELALLRELDCFHDVYDVQCTHIHDNESGSSSKSDLFKLLGLGKDERCMVYVKGGHRLDGGMADPTAMRPPCGILSPSRSSNAMAELLILPMNFPKLLHILKAALVNRHTPTAQLRQDMTCYLHGSPGYYYPAIASLLQRLKLSTLIAIPGLSLSLDLISHFHYSIFIFPFILFNMYSIL